MDKNLHGSGVFSYKALTRNQARKLGIALALGFAAMASGCGGNGGDDTSADASDFAQAVEDEEVSAASPEQAAYAAASLATTADRAPLGVNVEGVADWSRLQP